MAFYDTTTLLEVLRYTRQPTNFFLDLAFQRQINFETPSISFDVVYGDDRKLAPFVVPNVQGRGSKMDGYEQRSFKPAYVKPKDVVDPNMLIERQPGEALGTGSLSNDQRRNAVIAELLRQHYVRHRNTQEWMAARALIDGKVTIKGEDYPETLVDFRRHASLSYTLTGGALWSAGTADPLANLKAARVNANVRSGARIQNHVFGGEAWDKFTARVNLKDLLDTRYKDSQSEIKTMTDGYEGVEFIGTIRSLNDGGRMNVWVHTGKYIDETGSEQYMMDQNTVVGISPETVQGVRCFGAIKDAKANYRAIEIFPKNWENEDPSLEYLMTQSAPLMVPKQPDGTFSIKVA